MPVRELNRRGFLGTSAVAGANVAAAGVLHAQTSRTASPNETIRVGIVGPGARGTGLMNEFFAEREPYNARLSAVCDIWNQRRQSAAEHVRKVEGAMPKVYRRLEELLDDAEIDAVILATPDHQHAKMLQMAVHAGKDVYCEKPMANVLSEANAARDAVQNSDCIVQLGTQRRSDARYRQAAAILKEGRIGDIVKIDASWNAYSPYRWSFDAGKLSAIKQKDTDWSAFLLGKPARAWDPRIYRSFRLYRDFSSGIIDQWMSHAIDAIHLLTGHRYPSTAVAHGGIYTWDDYRENPDTIQVLLEYGGPGNQFLVNYSTSLVNGFSWDLNVLGTHGTLQAEKTWRVSGDGSRRRDALDETSEIRGVPGALHHMANWLKCVRNRNREGLYADVEAGYGHSIAGILATDAYWSGRRLRFDPQERRIIPG